MKVFGFGLGFGVESFRIGLNFFGGGFWVWGFEIWLRVWGLGLGVRDRVRVMV